ncbi:inactive peptidyl-prolyl cis-trans isomerase FKBP6 isoform X2 [Palaemon carinicauda]
MAQSMEDVSGDEGVLKREVSPGVGSDIPSGAFVTFHYSAFLEYCDEPFDSTHLRNKPERKALDGPELLPGLNIALKTMRKNETSRFLIKSQYAFGKLGCPPRIPGEETILYEIHIISFVDSLAANTYEEQYQHSATFQEKLEGAKGYHRKGNDLYREGNLIEARKAYIRGTWIMEDTKLKNEEDERQRGLLLMKLYSNLAQVYLDLKQPGRACTQCKLGLGVRGVDADDIRSKLHYRFGKAKMMLCDFSDSFKELKKAQRLRPHNLDISDALESLLAKKEKYEQQEKFMFQRIFQPKEEASQKSNLAVGKSKEKIDPDANILSVRPKFKKVIQDQIIEFITNPDINELPFPSNLSPDEIAYIAAAAKAADLLVTVRQKGMETTLKIAKP